MGHGSPPLFARLAIPTADEIAANLLGGAIQPMMALSAQMVLVRGLMLFFARSSANAAEIVEFAFGKKS
jgi:hypothetical protein